MYLLLLALFHCSVRIRCIFNARRIAKLVAVEMSVCPSSVWYCVKMEKYIVKLSKPHHSSIGLVSGNTKTLPKFPRDHGTNGGVT